MTERMNSPTDVRKHLDSNPYITRYEALNPGTLSNGTGKPIRHFCGMILEGRYMMTYKIVWDNGDVEIQHFCRDCNI